MNGDSGMDAQVANHSLRRPPAGGNREGTSETASQPIVSHKLEIQYREVHIRQTTTGGQCKGLTHH